MDTLIGETKLLQRDEIILLLLSYRKCGRLKMLQERPSLVKHTDTNSQERHPNNV